MVETLENDRFKRKSDHPWTKRNTQFIEWMSPEEVLGKAIGLVGLDASFQLLVWVFSELQGDWRWGRPPNIPFNLGS